MNNEYVTIFKSFSLRTSESANIASIHIVFTPRVLPATHTQKPFTVKNLIFGAKLTVQFVSSLHVSLNMTVIYSL